MRIKVNFLEKTERSLPQALMVMGCLVIILNGVQVAMAQWISHGPKGGRILGLAIEPQTPSTLYAGTQGGGVFKSSNGGLSWAVMNSGLANTAVFALAIDPQNPSRIYAGTFGGSVFVSSETSCSYSISLPAASYSSSGITCDQVTVTAIGCGTQAGASVSLSSISATVNTVTSAEISANESKNPMALRGSWLGASVINCWWDWCRDLVKNRLQRNLASPILDRSKVGASAFAGKSG